MREIERIKKSVSDWINRNKAIQIGLSGMLG